LVYYGCQFVNATVEIWPKIEAFAASARPYNASLLKESRPNAAAKAGSMPQPEIGLIMGSQSDWPTLKEAADILDALAIPFEKRIISAHRTPDRMAGYAKAAKGRGLKVIIAGAGGAAHLPGMTAAMTTLPVLGVPVESKALKGLDSLLSIVQMPGGVPVATFAIGTSGAKNAALHAAAIIALSDRGVAERLEAWRKKQTDSVAETPSDQ
jgi:5-(carboxyamino)imidazole ribonucleotide mutase